MRYKKPKKPKTLLGEYLCRQLAHVGKTQAQLAREIRFAPSQINRWITGESSPPRLEDIPLLAHALGCDPLEIVVVLLRQTWPTRTVDGQEFSKITRRMKSWDG